MFLAQFFGAFGFGFQLAFFFGLALLLFLLGFFLLGQAFTLFFAFFFSLLALAFTLLLQLFAFLALGLFFGFLALFFLGLFFFAFFFPLFLFCFLQALFFFQLLAALLFFALTLAFFPRLLFQAFFLGFLALFLLQGNVGVVRVGRCSARCGRWRWGHGPGLGRRCYGFWDGRRRGRRRCGREHFARRGLLRYGGPQFGLGSGFVVGAGLPVHAPGQRPNQQRMHQHGQGYRAQAPRRLHGG